MLYSITGEEISRIIPAVHTYPSFVAISAVFLLGERLVYLQWLAILIVAAGAVMVPLRQTSTGTNVWLGRSFSLLFAFSILMAGADVASKYALNHISVSNMYYIGVLCMSLLFFAVSIRRHVFQELHSMKRRNSALALLVINELLAPIEIVLAFWAIETKPVSLVPTILGSSPIFSLSYVHLCSVFFSGIPGMMPYENDTYIEAYRYHHDCWWYWHYPSVLKQTSQRLSR